MINTILVAAAVSLAAILGYLVAMCMTARLLKRSTEATIAAKKAAEAARILLASNTPHVPPDGKGITVQLSQPEAQATVLALAMTSQAMGKLIDDADHYDPERVEGAKDLVEQIRTVSSQIVASSIVAGLDVFGAPSTDEIEDVLNSL